MNNKINNNILIDENIYILYSIILCDVVFSNPFIGVIVYFKNKTSFKGLVLKISLKYNIFSIKNKKRYYHSTIINNNIDDHNSNTDSYDWDTLFLYFNNTYNTITENNINDLNITKLDFECENYITVELFKNASEVEKYNLATEMFF